MRMLNLPGQVAGTDAGDDSWPAVSARHSPARRAGICTSIRSSPHIPTEARRRAVTTSLRRISEQLQRLENPRLGPEQKAGAHRRCWKRWNCCNALGPASDPA